MLDTGAHLSHLSRAVERRLADLWSAWLFIGRPAYGLQEVAIPQTRDDELASNGRPPSCDFCPSAHMRDIHVFLGLDKGGDSYSGKVVVDLLNQEHPNRLVNALHVAVCAEANDNYPEVAAKLTPHVAQLLQLSYIGVVMGGHRRPVRVFVNSDFPAIINTVVNMGHSASTPCSCCLGMKCPTEAHSLLDCAFGTLHDLDCTHPPRTAVHLRELQERYGGLRRSRPNFGWLYTCRWRGHRSFMCHLPKPCRSPIV